MAVQGIHVPYKVFKIVKMHDSNVANTVLRLLNAFISYNRALNDRSKRSYDRSKNIRWIHGCFQNIRTKALSVWVLNTKRGTNY